MVCSPLCGVECRGSVQYPVFASSSSEMAVGVFLVIVSFGSAFAPTAHAHSYLYCYIVSSYFVA